MRLDRLTRLSPPPLRASQDYSNRHNGPEEFPETCKEGCAARTPAVVDVASVPSDAIEGHIWDVPAVHIAGTASDEDDVMPRPVRLTRLDGACYHRPVICRMGRGRVMQMNQRWTPGKDKPINYLIACFADAPAAGVALDALRAAGFADEDLVSVDGIEGYEEVQRAEGSTLLRRLVFAVEDATGDETTGRAAVVEELRNGHSLVFVYVPDEERTNKAYQIVRAAHGYRISRRGRWTNVNLP